MPYLDTLDYLNLNSLRSFPIKEGLSRKSTDGLLTIPDDFIVDGSFAITSDVTKKFYISKINSYVDTISIEIADDNNVAAGSFSINSALHTTNKEYYMTPTDAYAGANGKIVIGKLKNLLSLPRGNFMFTLATAELETRTIIPSIQSVNRVTFKNTDGTTYSVTGDVRIESRLNVAFKYDAGSNTVFLDVGDGLGLNSSCEEDRPYIETINGIGPDEDGNFTLDFANCITVTPLASNTGLLLDDICCKPCAGCDDIQVLTDRLTALESDLVALRNYYTNLLTMFDTFQISVNSTCDC